MVNAYDGGVKSRKIVSSEITHPYHIVQERPWPLTGSFRAGILIFTFRYWFHSKINLSLLMIATFIIMTILSWWRDVIREASYLGEHTYKVRRGLEWGMLLFITSEVMFFRAFFWAFFHRSLTPTFDLGCIWPPIGVTPLNPFAIPLLNTAVLLSSGATVTYAHHSMVKRRITGFKEGLAVTVILGIYFTYLQACEYLDTEFRFADRIFGSTFFIATGFHGAHVLIGSLFLLTCLLRIQLTQITKSVHLGFEAAAWYWHFVDIVWLFLFIIIYWWATS